MPAPIPYDQRGGVREAAAPAPPPPDAGWLEGIAASFRTARDSQPTHENEEKMYAYGDLANALVERGYAHSRYWNYANRGYGEPMMVSAIQRDVDAERAKARAAGQPDPFPGVAASWDGFEQQWRENMRGRMARDAATAHRTGFVPWLAGSLAGGLTDPVNLGSMVLGFGEAKLAVTVAREAAVNTAVEAIEQPLINVELQHQGQPQMTGRERIAGLGLAAVTGAAFPLGIKGIGAGVSAGRGAFEKTVAANWDRLPQGLRDRWTRGAELDDADLADLVELHVGRDNMSQAESAAVNVLDRESWAARANPFAPNGAGVQLHDTALHGTMAAILDGIPVAPRPERPTFTAPQPGGSLAGRDMGETAIGSGTVAGDAQARFMSKVRRAESGGNDVAAATGSSAYGRYQFTKGTWLHYYLERYGRDGLSNEQIYAKRADGAVQDRLMADMTADSAARLRRMGAPVTEGNLYLMHFLGPADARKVLHAEPGTPLAGLISDRSIAANARILEGKTAGDVVAFVDRKMGSRGSGELSPRVDVDAGRVGDAELAARLQEEADRLQAELASAQRGAAEPASAGEDAPRDMDAEALPDLRMADGADARWRAAAAVEREAKASALSSALDALPEREAVTPVRQVASITEARAIAKDQVINRPLRDAGGTIEVVVSRKNMEKMGSASAVRNSTSAADHATALANVDHLFAQAHEFHAGPDLKALDAGRDPASSSIGSVRQFMAAMETPDGPVAVRMVVKDMRKPGEQKPLYTLQTIAVGKRAGERSDTMAPPPGGIEPTSAKAVGRVGPEDDIATSAATDKAARDLAEGELIADLPEAERTAFRDPAGASAQAQAQSLLHDARAMLGTEGMDDPDLARLIDDIDEDHAVIDTLRGCL